MRKDTMGIVKGIGTGLAAGMTVGYVSSKLINTNTNTLKNKTDKTIHAVGDFLGNASHFLKHM